MPAFSTNSIKRARVPSVRFPEAVSRSLKNGFGQESRSYSRVGYDNIEVVEGLAGKVRATEWNVVSEFKRAELREIQAGSWADNVRFAVGGGEFGDWFQGMISSLGQMSLEAVANAQKAGFTATIETEIVNQKKRTKEKPRRWRTAQTRKRRAGK